jgi:hypothetical protein
LYGEPLHWIWICWTCQLAQVGAQPRRRGFPPYSVSPDPANRRTSPSTRLRYFPNATGSLILQQADVMYHASVIHHTDNQDALRYQLLLWTKGEEPRGDLGRIREHGFDEIATDAQVTGPTTTRVTGAAATRDGQRRWELHLVSNKPAAHGGKIVMARIDGRLVSSVHQEERARWR